MKVLRNIIMLCCLFLTSSIATAQDSHWSCDERSYEYSMTVYMSTSLHYDEIVDFGNYEIAAFCDEECRGLMSVENSGNVTYGYLRIRSNNATGESISFKLYDKVNAKEITSDSIISFVADSRLGYPSETYRINFGGYVIMVTSSDSQQGSVSGGGEFGANKDITLLATPETGYHFDSWSNGVKENPYKFLATQNISLSASFLPNQYTITFDTDGGSTIAPVKQDYNSAVTKPADPTKTGYTFTGWDKEIPTTIPAENITIKATWKINQYTITFDTDGGSTIAPITQDYNTTVTKPADPTKTGYTFTGWDKEIPATIPAENITIKATWKINQYTITFDTDGGSEVAPITQDYATAVTKPADPTKTGYTFTGWDKEIPTTIPAENITIKATWKINQYTITFDTDGGSEVAPITQDYATAVTKPADPTKTGYTFTGWDKEIPTTIPAENITIKATWKINQYTIKFVVDDVTIQEQKLDYGSTITAPADPIKEGYTFNGWSPEVDATVPDQDVTYTALFFINSYKLTYKVDGDVYKEYTIEYGASITPEEEPTKEGYNFSGWSEIPDVMPSHDVEVSGSFTLIPTAIQNIMGNSSSEIKYYDLQGNRLEYPKKGINIINGKKVLIK